MELEAKFHAIRESVERMDPPDSLRQSLMQEFTRANRMRARKRVATWALTAVAAAAMIWVVALVRPPEPRPDTLVAVNSVDTDDLMPGDEFQAVPYAPVLASGESVREIHTELAADTLTRLGVFVAAANADPVSVDLIVGQDDAPLAVRVNNEEEFREKETK